ncbi:hypothetical protein [Bacillus manliponensis]|uniref:hypothetical protein n=1 Tax=Bacillus manliponensis TaxID=574376 RepID=UPI0035161895
MLKEFGIGLITSTILLSTNGVADTSTNSLSKERNVINNAPITTEFLKSDDYWRVGDSRTVKGISAEPLIGWPDVIDIKINRDGTITMTTVGKGYAEVKVTKSNGKEVYYVFEVR